MSHRANVHVESLASRYIPTWTPDDFDQAIAQANGGSLGHAADLSLAIMQDERVRGVLATRTLGLLGLPLTWDPGPEPAGWLRFAPEAELNRLLSWGLMLGVGFAYVQPWGALDVWHPRWFRYDESTRQWYVQTREGEQAIRPGDGRWVIYTPYGSREPWFYGLWLALAIPFLAKRFAIHDRARASEVFGSAMIVGESPEGATEEKRVRFLADLQRLARSSRIVLPEGYRVTMLEAQGQTWGIYDQSVAWADEAITIAIAGQVVTTQGQSGFSRGDVHERIAQSLTRFGAETLSTCLAEQFIPQVWGRQTYPHWDVDPPGDRLASVAGSLATFASALASANTALAPYGKRADLAGYAKDFDEIRLMPILAPPPPPGADFFAYELDGGVVTIDEMRARKGLPPLPDGKGAMTVPEARAIADFGAAQPAIGVVSQRDYPGELARKMTEAGLARCEHGSCNRCRLCGIERERDFVAGDPPVWAVRWRPIAQSRAVTHVQSRKRVKGQSFAEPPREFRIFAAGPNPINGGDDIAWFTARSARLIADTIGDRRLMIDLEHLSLSGDDPDARGWADVEIRNGECWATNVEWLSDGDRRIRGKRQQSISPAFATSPDGEIIELINCALTALPAMPYAARLASRKGNVMDPKIYEMLGLPPDATPEQVIEAIAALKMAAMKREETPVAPAPQTAPAPAPASNETTVAAQSLIASMAADMRAMRERLDGQERQSLIAQSAHLRPSEREWLAKQPLDTVRTYVQSVAAGRTVEVPPEGAPPANAAVDAVARATGMSRDYVRESMKGGA